MNLPPAILEADPQTLQEQWLAAWPKALEVWSKYTRLRMPILCLTTNEAKKEGLTGSFAMIRLQDQAIVVSLPEVNASGVQAFAVEILAHEIGHHVLAPGTLTDHTQMIARMRWSLPTVEHHAAMVANLYTDLLINDRLQRGSNLRLGDVYRTLGERGDGDARDAVWRLYTRIYEILWSLERESLRGGRTNDRLEGDAMLGARLIRSYSRDWLDGSGRFAALLLPHLLEDVNSGQIIKQWMDTENAGSGGEPSGLVDVAPDELNGAIHPAQDPDLSDFPESDTENELDSPPSQTPGPTAKKEPAHGQTREPFQYGEILKAAGVDLNDHEIAVRYYRERALPHLIPFPSRRAPESVDPLPEGLEPWDIGQSLDEVDWLQSVLQSPRVIPGMTTVQRVWGTTEGKLPEQVPLDLDLYVDSSGSMPNPQRLTSFLTLAGAIMSLSALRAGARVKATLWSGKNQVTETDGYVRDEAAILKVLTGFYGGATAFPIHTLRKTYENRRKDDRPAVILVISDDGISTMFDNDERGNSGWHVSAMALERARGGGVFVLNLPPKWEEHASILGPYSVIKQARDEQGWRVHGVTNWDELVTFARQFSQSHYGTQTAEATSP